MKSSRWIYVAVVAVAALFVLDQAYGQVPLDTQRGNAQLGRAINIHATNADIDGSWELMARDGSYSQIGDSSGATTDSIAIMTTATDSVRFVLTLIRADTTRMDTTMRIYGPDTVVTSPAHMAKFLEFVRIDSGRLENTLTIKQGNKTTHITSIAPNLRSDEVAHYYCADKEIPQVADFQARVHSALATDTTRFQLRYYAEGEYSRYTPAGASYEVLSDLLIVGAGSDNADIKRPIRLPGAFSGNAMSHGYVGAFAKSTGTDVQGTVNLQIESYGRGMR